MDEFVPGTLPGWWGVATDDSDNYVYVEEEKLKPFVLLSLSSYACENFSEILKKHKEEIIRSLKKRLPEMLEVVQEYERKILKKSVKDIVYLLSYELYEWSDYWSSK
jgi:hypothetical protein